MKNYHICQSKFTIKTQNMSNFAKFVDLKYENSKVYNNIYDMISSRERLFFQWNSKDN